MTVNVTNKEETGKVTWVLVAPGGTDAYASYVGSNSSSLVRSMLSPTVTDPDGSVTGPTYKWYRGSLADRAARLELELTYTVVADDVGKRIRVDATYTDGSSGPAETVRFTSENPVQVAAQPDTNDASGVCLHNRNQES